MVDKIKLQEILKDSRRIAIFPSKVAGVDAFVAGAGLYRALKDQDYNVTLMYPGKIPEGCEGILLDTDINSDLGERELLLSVDYSDSNASKVYWNTENDVLYLTLKPINKDFDLKNIKAQVKGFDFDTAIVIGAQSLSDLGTIYQELQSEFQEVGVINMDNTDRNQRFGDLNIVDSKEESLSLLVLNNLFYFGSKVNSKLLSILSRGTKQGEFK